jgi:predicted Zn finger-like uncharacterized protein
MFTICPKCALTLAVSAADLRVAQGYVRCGRCSSVFNALARLTEERQGASPEPASSPSPPATTAPLPSPALPGVGPETGAPPEPLPAPAPAPPEDPAAASDLDLIPEEALEFNPDTTSAESVFVQPQPDPQWEAATGSFKAMVAANQEPVLELEPEPDGLVEVEIDAGFLSAIIQADARGATLAVATPAPPLAPGPEPTPLPASPEAVAAPAPVSTAAASQPAPARTAPLRHTGPHARPAPDADLHPRAAGSPRPDPEREPPSVRAPGHEHLREREAPTAADIPDAAEPLIARPYLWLLGTLGAAVLLVAQIVNHYRDDLAASARFNHPLTALYRSLGVTLKPHWDLHTYDVRQLGASVDPGNPGHITVRASIKNAGQQAQPLPLLRVTLQDRFGNRIAARDVQPQFYVPGAVPASALLGAGQRIDAEMAFVDPGASAVGFELDACLPASGGGVTCANDVTAR